MKMIPKAIVYSKGEVRVNFLYSNLFSCFHSFIRSASLRGGGQSQVASGGLTRLSFKKNNSIEIEALAIVVNF